MLVWGRQIDVNRRDLFGVEDQVTTEVVSALQLEISSVERARLNQRYTQNPEAYDQYLQGRALLANYSDANMRNAIDHFERALQIAAEADKSGGKSNGEAKPAKPAAYPGELACSEDNGLSSRPHVQYPQEKSRALEPVTWSSDILTILTH